MSTGIHRHYSPGLLGPRARIMGAEFNPNLGTPETKGQYEPPIDCECSYQGITAKFRIDIDTKSDDTWRLTGKSYEAENAAGELVTWRQYECLRDEPAFKYPTGYGMESYLRRNKCGVSGAVKGKTGDIIEMPDSFVIGSTCVIAAAIIAEEYQEILKMKYICYQTYLTYCRTQINWFRKQVYKFNEAHLQAYDQAYEMGRVATLRMVITHPYCPGAAAFRALVGWPGPR